MKTSAMIAVILPIMLAAGAASANVSVQRRFAWDDANARASSARTQQGFLDAAAKYRQLIDAGVRNGVVFYNLGVALLNAEQHDQAISALTRSERYMGTTPEIKRNLRIAIAKKRNERSASLPINRVPFFWHYGLSLSTRIAISAVAFLMAWVALTLRRFGFRVITGRLLVVTAMVAVLFGFSVTTSLYQESRDDARLPISEASGMNVGVQTL